MFSSVSEVQRDVKEIKHIISSPDYLLQARGNQLVLINPPLPTELFSGREKDLKQMEESFDFSKTSMELKKQCRFVLYGVGGIGKTQLALKFIDQNEDKYVMFMFKLYLKFSDLDLDSQRNTWWMLVLKMPLQTASPILGLILALRKPTYLKCLLNSDK